MVDDNKNTARADRRYGWKSKVTLLIGTTVLMIVLCELVLLPINQFDPYPRYAVGEHEARNSPWYVLDENIGWKIKREIEDINAQGFRGRRDFDATTTQKKIILLGDSFTYGSDVEFEATFGALIDADLDDAVVYNMGVPGFGVDQMWLTLRHEALPRKPELIVVGLCDADFRRSQSAYRPHEGLNKPAFKLTDGELVRKTEADRLGQPAYFLEHYSRVWMAGRLAAQWLGHRLPVGEWWHLNEAIIEQMRADCADADTTVLFIYIPTVEWRSFPTLAIHMDMAAANFINLRDGAPTDPRTLYLTDNPYPHFNERGHRYVADRILAWVREHTREPGPAEQSSIQPAQSLPQ